MFFIFGFPRSGTTFLKELLNLNSKIFIPHETDFIIPIAFIIDRVKDEVIGKKIILEIIVSSERYHESLADSLSKADIANLVNSSSYSLFSMLNKIYDELALRKGVSFAGDKSPNDLNYLNVLIKHNLFSSDLKIIHIVRDVRDVILSLLDTGWLPPNTNEMSVASSWQFRNLALTNHYKNCPEKYLLIKYEDLISNPQFHLSDICRFLGVNYETSMLNYSLMGKDLKHYSHHKNLGLPPISERCYAWKKIKTKNFDPITTAAYPGLKTFDYDTKTSSITDKFLNLIRG
jgi:hypothetical protein